MSLIVFNGKFLAQPLTGVQRAALELLRALDADLAARPGGPVSRWELLHPPVAEAPRWQVLRARTVPMPALLPTRLQLWEQWCLPRAAAGASRLVHLAGSGSWLGAERACAMLHDAAVFDHADGYRPAFVAWYRQLFRRFGRRAVLRLTPSAFSRDRLAAALGQPASRFALLPLGADHLDGVAPLAAPAGPPYLLAVASHNPTKNLARLLAAFARVAADRPQLRLRLVGDRREQVFAGQTLAPHPQVELIGRVSDAELQGLYDGALALAFPSLVEGFGLPPLEAMRRGCPVLAARAGSLPEVLGEAALWVDPRSVDDIAAGLQRLVDDEALRSRLAAEGRRHSERYRWADSGRRLRELLEASLR